MTQNTNLITLCYVKELLSHQLGHYTTDAYA